MSEGGGDKKSGKNNLSDPIKGKRSIPRHRGGGGWYESPDSRTCVEKTSFFGT